MVYPMTRPEVGSCHRGPRGLVEVRATTQHHTVARIRSPGQSGEPESAADLVVVTHADFLAQYHPES
ncbi:MAG: hypothetical protein PHE83_18675 [Opitutaceae bacterium]|nr:hypothetical protein [Opitutaceae bacterium]